MDNKVSTLKLVADRAGVSTMTVSRVINKKSGFSEETKRKVEEAIQFYDYHPNPIAKSLATSRSNIIGLIIYSSIEDNSVFFYEIMLGVQLELNKRGYDLLLYSQLNEKHVEKVLKSRLVEGVILMGNINPKDIEMLKNNNMPYVVVGRREIEGINVEYVSPQYVDGVKEGINYLISLGHKEIGFIGAARTFEPDYDKLLGYQTALFENSIPYNPAFVKEVADSKQEAYLALKNLIELNVSAVFLSSSNCIAGGYEAIKELGLNVPEDLSVVGLISGSTIASHISDELTQIIIPKKKIGKAAASKLLATIDKEYELQNMPIKLEFTVKNTCKSVGK